MPTGLEKLAALRAARELADDWPTILDNVRQEAFHCRRVVNGETQIRDKATGQMMSLTGDGARDFAAARMLDDVAALERRLAWYTGMTAGQRAAVSAAMAALSGGTVGQADIDTALAETAGHVATLKAALLAAKAKTAADVRDALDATLASVPRTLKVAFRDSVP